jgi:hypothetical protein
LIGSVKKVDVIVVVVVVMVIRKLVFFFVGTIAFDPTFWKIYLITTSFTFGEPVFF